jgi:DNA repair protein RadC
MTNYKIKKLHKSDRPREKIVKHGVEFLNTSELLAVLIGSGYKGKNVIRLSKDILSKYHSKNLPRLSYKQLTTEKGVGKAAACRILAAFELAKRLLLDRDDEAIVVNEPKDVFELLKDMKNYKKEHFIGLYLNARNQVICKETISVGTLNANFIHPREAFEPAIKHHAANVIFVHNHPSGYLERSSEDIRITKELVSAGDLLGIEVTDHIIISEQGFASFKENGWM